MFYVISLHLFIALPVNKICCLSGVNVVHVELMLFMFYVIPLHLFIALPVSLK